MGSIVEQSMNSRLFSDGGADRLEEKTSVKTDLTCCGSGRADTILSYIQVSLLLGGERVACCMGSFQRIGCICESWEEHRRGSPNLDHKLKHRK